MRIPRFAPALILLVCSSGRAAGLAHSDNFIVLTPASPNQEAGQAFAASVLAKAEEYRRSVAREWLGEVLPAGVGKTMINVEFSDTKDSGLAWCKDHSQRPLHNVYLATSPAGAG